MLIWSKPIIIHTNNNANRPQKIIKSFSVFIYITYNIMYSRVIYNDESTHVIFTMSLIYLVCKDVNCTIVSACGHGVFTKLQIFHGQSIKPCLRKHCSILGLKQVDSCHTYLLILYGNSMIINGINNGHINSETIFW